jgi:hypothetical protein
VTSLLTDRLGTCYAPRYLDEVRATARLPGLPLHERDCMAMRAYEGFSEERGIAPDDRGRRDWVMLWRALDGREISLAPQSQLHGPSP